MERFFFLGNFWIPAILMCTSCNDDPKLAAKRELQQIEITRLKGEIALARERLGNSPEDKASQLEEAEKQLNDAALEASRLEAEVAELQQLKADLEKEFAQYKRKYPLN